MDKIANIRSEYSGKPLGERHVSGNPYEQFKCWFEEALKSNVSEPTAMNLATMSPEGMPTSRIVLLKGFDENGFVFYTNYNSDKGKHLDVNPKASINIFWIELHRQLRIEGVVIKTDRETSRAYFDTRPFESRVSAYISAQSSPVKDREALEKEYKAALKQFEGKTVECPEHWGGYILKPQSFEFWQGRENRLHDRIKYDLKNNDWEILRLAP